MQTGSDTSLFKEKTSRLAGGAQIKAPTACVRLYSYTDLWAGWTEPDTTREVYIHVKRPFSQADQPVT